MLAKLKQELLGSSLKQLKPNQVFRQSSSMVLLKGSLHVTAEAATPPPSTDSDNLTGTSSTRTASNSPEVMCMLRPSLLRHSLPTTNPLDT